MSLFPITHNYNEIQHNHYRLVNNHYSMLFFILLLLVGLLLAFYLFAAYYMAAPVYRGPVSDHFDGKYFHNPGGRDIASGISGLLKWQLNRDAAPWTEVHELATASVERERVGEGELVVSYVNHATFLIQMDGINILTDPVWSKRISPVQWAGPKRMRPPGIRMEDLPPIDVILLSHNHWDHLDIPAMKLLVQTHAPLVVTPLGVKQFVDKECGSNAVELDWWKEADLPGNLQVQALPAQHFSGRGMYDRNRTLWCGYCIKSKAGNVYFVGDTGYGDFFTEIGERCAPIRLALIPIGAYRPQWFMSVVHCSPQEALQIHRDCGAQQSLAMHWGTFALADDGMDEAAHTLRATLREEGIAAKDFQVLMNGESCAVPPVESTISATGSSSV